MKKIIIIGSGFAGVSAAKGLIKKLEPEDQIILISQHNYQLFNSNLFEVATAEEELASINALKKSICIPLSEVLDFKKITFVESGVNSINPQEKFVQAGSKKFNYDYLIIATGSVTDYFNIPGAEQFALPLKSFTDALRIKDKIEFTIQGHRLDMHKPNLRIVVAGGGYSGVEFVAELAHEINILCWKYNYLPEKIEICIIEAMDCLIPGFSNRLSQDALWKLKSLGVRVQLSSKIESVDQHTLNLSTGEKEPYDVLVWTTGVKAKLAPFTIPLDTDKKGRLITNQFLQVSKFENIFAIGDCACVVNNDGKVAPPSAQDAVTHGKYLAYCLSELIKNHRPKPYIGKAHGFIVTMGGKNAIMDYNGFYIKGFPAFIFRQLANFRYFLGVLGLWKAIKYSLFDIDIYSRND